MTTEKFDYIIVGAGSAGAVVASRLTEDPACSVLLLEAGPSHKRWKINMPAAFFMAVEDPSSAWHFRSEPESYIGGRVVEHPRGRALGGSSSVNAMVFTRGHRMDFDGWAHTYGCEGWSYADVLPYFRRSETFEGGADQYRGDKGPIKVYRPDYASYELDRAFVAAGVSAGYPETPDYNGAQQEGFGAEQLNIHNGQRCSTAHAYLEPFIGKRSNLEVRTGCEVDRVLFEGRQAIGVSYHSDGVIYTVKARREVILSAGAIKTPQLLMVSGVGPVEELNDLGIPLVHDLPGVGKNLQDHPDACVQFRTVPGVSLGSQLNKLRMMCTGIQWFTTKTGLATSSQFHSAANICSGPDVDYPDMKLSFLRAAFIPDTFKAYPGDTFQVHFTLMRTYSRGELTLTSRDARVAPKLQFNYLSDQRDRETIRRGVRIIRSLAQQPALAALVTTEIAPGDAVVTDEQIDDYISKTLITAYHPTSTCTMGPRDNPLAVVDPELRVYGVKGLRVIDASIMPRTVNVNTNATTIMIGERGADFIKARGMLKAASI